MKGKPGAIVQIPTDKECRYHTYAQILKNDYMVFFDCRKEKGVDASEEEILHSRIIFSGCVAGKDVVNQGTWPIVYNSKILKEVENKIKPTFWQSRDDKARCIIVNYDETEYPAKPEDCMGLEMMQIWLSHNVETRIFEFYDGKPYNPGEHYKLRF